MKRCSSLILCSVTTFVYRGKKVWEFGWKKGRTSRKSSEDKWQTGQCWIQNDQLDEAEEDTGEPEGAIQTAAGRCGEREAGEQGQASVGDDIHIKEWERKGNWQNRRILLGKTRVIKWSVETGEEKGRAGEAAAGNREAAAE